VLEVASVYTSLYSYLIPSFPITSKGLWRWHANITITILDIIHRPAFYLKRGFSETGLSPLSGRTYLVGPLDRASIWLQTPVTKQLGLIKPTQHKPTTTVDILYTSKSSSQDRRMDDVWNCDNYIKFRYFICYEIRFHTIFKLLKTLLC
jgi:hypothetical protein